MAPSTNMNSTSFNSSLVSVATNDNSFAALFPFSVGLNGVDQDRNYLVIKLLAILLGFTVLTILFLRWFTMWFHYTRQIAVMSNPEHQAFWKFNAGETWPWIKRHFIYAPIGHQRHNQEITLSSAVNVGTLPGRAQFVILLIYSIFTIAWTLTLPYGKPKREVIAALRGRSGLIAIFNLFPTITFALRNNPCIWLLHVSYDTFQLFHRWCARIFILECIVHVGAWIGNTQEAGGWKAVGQGLSTGPHAHSFTWGTVAAVCATIILIHSWSPIRHAFYELFLATHKLMVFFVLIGTLLHLKFDNVPQSTWLVVILLIWVYDYVMRFLRIIRWNSTLKSRSSRVVVEALDEKVCRVTFHLPRYWKAEPGTHVHIYLPQFGGFQSHPFSVAWTEHFEITPQGDSLPVHHESKSPDREPNYRSTVSVVCRVRSGFTAKLWEKVHAMDKQTCETHGYMEGFYGGNENLASYGDIVLFAGGIGITHQIMFCKQLIEGYMNGTIACRRLTLVWSIPDRGCLNWVAPWMNEILNMTGRRDLLDILIYITRENVSKKITTSSSGKVVMRAGRCPVDDVLDDIIKSRKGAIAVTVCGPGAFADNVRNETRKRAQKGVVDFIEEAFTY